LLLAFSRDTLSRCTRLLESPLALVFLPLLELLPGLLLLTFLTITVGFFLQSPLFSSTLYP
jgi:hypothetical protein